MKILANHSVDCVIFGIHQNQLCVLLVKWQHEEYGENWALPGQFIYQSETLEQAAERILCEWTGLNKVYLEQCRTYSALARVPNNRVLSTSFVSLVNSELFDANFEGIGSEVAWFPVNELPELAFDHREMVSDGIQFVREKAHRKPIGLNLLAEEFSLTELQRVYEVLLEKELDRRNFRKKVASYELLINTEKKQQGVAHRAAYLYKFDINRYRNLEKEGIFFEL